ncbi:TPA: hypothetical protein L4W69_005649, partial [Pseudomonas aeruginosa]|nr:hypothetical protein [Pseudomonas aeruginosa]
MFDADFASKNTHECHDESMERQETLSTDWSIPVVPAFASGSASVNPSMPNIVALRERLNTTSSHHLSEFIGFQQLGSNILFPKTVDIKALQPHLNSEMVVIDMEAINADTVIDMEGVDGAAAVKYGISKQVGANLSVEQALSPEALTQAAELGEKVLRDTLLGVGKQVYQRTFARALDEMLQGTLLQGTRLEELKLEHGVQLKGALHTFCTSEQPLPERLQRLAFALQGLPDDALLAQGGTLRACVQLCGDTAVLWREVAEDGLSLDNARRLQRGLLKVLDNPVLAGGSAVESLREMLLQLDQGLSELTALSRHDLSLENVLSWVKDSTLFKDTLAVQYQGTVQLFDELGALFSALSGARTDGGSTSPLARATGLLERVCSGQLGPLLTTHLSGAFAPLFEALHGLRQTLEALRHFPTGQPPLRQLQWLGEQAGQASPGVLLSEALIAPLQSGIETLGSVQEFRKAIGAPPRHAPLGEQAKWLAGALDQPLPAGVEKLIVQVVGQERFATLDALGKQAVSLRQHVAHFPEGQGVFKVFRWANALAQDTHAPALLERLLPANVQQQITDWSAPLEQAQRLAPRLADYPQNGSWQEKLGWAAVLLTSDEAPALLEKILPETLARPLVQPFEMIRLAQGFPTRASPLAQLQWSTGLLGSVQGQKVLQAYAPAGYDQVFAQLDSLGSLLQGVDTLRQTLASDASLPSKLEGVTRLLMQPLVDQLKQHPEVLLKVANRISGGNSTTVGVALTALRLYLEMPAGLSRTDMLKYGGKEVVRELAREFGGVVGLAADYGTPVLKAKEYVQQTWELYQAWSEPGTLRMERELGELVNLLKRDLPLPEGLKPLLDVLPALPALLRAREHYSALPEGMALSEQTKQMTAHLAQSDSAALARIYDAIEAYAVGALSEGLDRIMASVSDPLKIGRGAAAAPLDSAVPAGRTAALQSGPSNTLAWTQALGGLAGLTASVAGGVWAWQNWDGGFASSYAPVAAQEMQTFTTNQTPEVSDETAESLRQRKQQSGPHAMLSPQRKAQVAAAMSLLGAVVSTGFMANGIYGLTSRQVETQHDPEQVGATLDRLEAETREDFYAGDSQRLRVDIDHFLDRLEVDVPGLSNFTNADSAQEPSSLSPREDGSLEHSARVRRSPGERSAVERARLPEPLQGDGAAERVRRSTEVFSIDRLLPLMKEAHDLLLAIKRNKSEGQTEEALGVLYGRLGQIKSELTQLRDDLADFSPDSAGEFLMIREVYAYYQLAEMKAFYGPSEATTWKEFDPAAIITYRYTDLKGQQTYAYAPLIDFLNGRIAAKLKKQGVEGGFDFPKHESSEITAMLQAGNSDYSPGIWTKEMALRDAAKKAQPDGQLTPPQMTDLLKIKIQLRNPLGQKTGDEREVPLLLDTFIEKGIFGAIPHLYYADYDVEFIWPKHYPSKLIATLEDKKFRERYEGGNNAVAELKQRLDDVGKDRLVAFDTKYKRYSKDDHLRIANIVTQYSWQDLVLQNDGTPIGFTVKDVLAKAIDLVEQQIVHYEGERDKLSTDDRWRQDYQTEIDNLFGVLKVLHQKESISLHLRAQSSARDILIDSKVQEFASASLRDKAQRIDEHPYLKGLKADSPLTVKRQQGSEITRFSMPLSRVLGGEHERIATQGVRVEVEWPSGLSTADPLLQELIDGCTVYRAMQARGMAVKEAKDRLRIPTVLQQLENGLERVVREEAPKGQKHTPMKLSDTVNVRFRPMEIHNPEHSILKKPLQVVNKTYTLMQIMAKAPEREYIKMTHYRKMEVDTGKKFPAEVIKGLRDIDWQRKIESTVEELRQNKQLGEDWKLVFGSQIADKMAAADVSIAKSLTLNGDRLPGVYILEKSSGIELHSLFNKKSWTFDNLDKAAEALNDTDGTTTATLYAWLDEHRDAYEREANSGANSLLLGACQDAGRVAENAFGDLLDQMASDADTHLKSNAELNTHRVFQFFANVSPLIGLATLPISGPAAFLVSAGLAALPFAELAVADTKEEFKETAVQAGITAAFEVGPTIVVSTLSKLPAKQIAKGIAQKLRGVGDDLFKGLKNTNPPLPTVRLEPLRQVPTGKVGNLA